MRLVQGMYANALSCVHVCEGYSEEFEVKVGVHQGSVLSSLLFIIIAPFEKVGLYCICHVLPSFLDSVIP